MPRFLTNTQIAEQKAAEEVAESERKRVEAEAEKLRLESLYAERFLAISGTVMSIWSEYARARDLPGYYVALDRETYSFILLDMHEEHYDKRRRIYDTSGLLKLTLQLVLRDGSYTLLLKDITNWRSCYPKYDLREFIQAVADETSMQVSVFRHVPASSSGDEGDIPAQDKLEYVIEPHQRNSEKESSPDATAS